MRLDSFGIGGRATVMRTVTVALALWALCVVAWPAVAQELRPQATLFKASPAALALYDQVLGSTDNAQRPFAIVDKQHAQVLVYHADGTLAGASPVLLGQMPGDGFTQDVRVRTQEGRLRLQDRTTPAGRFDSVPGRNLTGEGVVWVDYATAFAIHRLRPAPAAQQRPARLASSNPAAKRISAGCVVVPEVFYDGVIAPVLGQGPSVIYVIPEDSDWRRLFTS